MSLEMEIEKSLLRISLWKVDRFTPNQDRNDPSPTLHIRIHFISSEKTRHICDIYLSVT